LREKSFHKLASKSLPVAVVYTVRMEYGFNKTDFGKTILASSFITNLGTVVGLGLIFVPSP
jgi:glutathione-regulated potassium-efflux system ancillary protein KefC